MRASRGMTVVAPVDDVATDSDVSVGELLGSVIAELDVGGVRNTSAGQSALILARRLESGHETGQAVAALSKQLQALIESALSSVSRADAMDEVTRKRDAKLKSAGRA